MISTWSRICPFGDAEFDAVLLSVSVQYLVHPVEVFADVGRVLRPGGHLIVSFSNRMFPTKAVRLWREGNDLQHISRSTRPFALRTPARRNRAHTLR